MSDYLTKVENESLEELLCRLNREKIHQKFVIDPFEKQVRIVFCL